MSWTRMIEDRISRVPASVMRGGLADAVRWKDAVSDALKLLKKRGATETELTVMLSKLNTLAGET